MEDRFASFEKNFIDDLAAEILRPRSENILRGQQRPSIRST